MTVQILQRQEQVSTAPSNIIKTNMAGTGLTSTYDKLCQYSCLFGYCPIHSCTVQLVGQLQVPPPILSSPDTTAFLLTLTQEEQDLCIFVCSRSQDACDLDACFLPPLGPTAPPAPPPPTRPSTSAPCIDQSNPIVGDMTCVDSNGGEMSCGECLGLEGSPPANTISGGDFCFIITAVKGGDIDQWNQTACPGDPPPPTYPNGTAVDPSTADSIVNAFCAAAGSDGILGFATWAACYMYSFYGDGDLLDEEMVGITGKHALYFAFV